MIPLPPLPPLAKDKRVALLTSGGDAPGMNAAVRAATALCLAEGYRVVGVKNGYRGLLRGELAELGMSDVGGILREGGTILGSARCLEMHERASRDVARGHLRAAGVGGLIVIGGNGSLTGAMALTDPDEAPDAGFAVIGIPASIDNDIGLTGMAIGVDTAMNTIVEACDKICDTASAHDRTFIVEVMGRNCGYLAMTAAVASGADAVLFREAERTPAEIVELIARTVLRARERAGRPQRVVVIKSEGTPLKNDELKTRVDARLVELLGAAGPPVETRVTVLGHVVRGGRPSAFDRLLASRLAHVAVRGLLAGETRKMAGWLLPLDPAWGGALPAEIGARSASDPYCHLVDLAAVIDETKKLLDGSSTLTRWRRDVFARIEDVLSL